ncbi:YspA SLOG family protein [anaerobic digester metagenome]
MSNETDLRQHRCCFTGHRPEKLSISEKELEDLLREEIRNAIADGFTTFISGMARGADIVAAELVLKEQLINPGIHLICALPFQGFGDNWSQEWRDRRNLVLQQANFIHTVCSGFSYSSYQRRNEWMVDHSARVIVICNGSSGGTKNTIQYAQQKGVSVLIRNG